MSYLRRLPFAILFIMAPSVGLTNNTAQDLSVTGSIGFTPGEVDGVTPDTALEFNATFEYFTSQYTYVLLQTGYEYVEVPIGTNEERSVVLSSTALGFGREVPISSFAGFYLEGVAGFGYGAREDTSGNTTSAASVSGGQQRIELGFRGSLDRDEWAIGGAVSRTNLRVASGTSESEDSELSAALQGEALIGLTDQMLLGPYGRIDDDATGTLGLRLRLIGL